MEKSISTIDTSNMQTVYGSMEYENYTKDRISETTPDYLRSLKTYPGRSRHGERFDWKVCGIQHFQHWH